MSQFFDLLQKLKGQGDDAPSAPVSASSQNTEEAFQLQQILADVFPEPQRQGCADSSSPYVGVAGSENISSAFQDRASDFQQIPVEQVYIQPESRIVVQTDPNSPGADRFRFLRMRLQNSWNAGKLRTLLITSPLPEDGKSTIALNLATALADGGKRAVLLIEADLYRPTLTQRLGLKNRPGLVECLEGEVDLVSAMRRLAPLGWYFLPAGRPPRRNPAEVLQSESLSGIMHDVSPHFDWILIDSPPVVPLADTLSLSRHADANLLVVRAGRTPREVVERALALLTPEHVLGVVLNGSQALNRLYSKYYGYSLPKAITTS